MASRWETFCRAVIEDLQANIPALLDVHVHLLSPADPEDLVADAGERHLSVRMSNDRAREAQPLTTDGGKAFTEQYAIVYWEHAGDVSARGVEDDEAWGAMLEVAEAIQLRLFQRSNVFLGGTELTEYVGTVTQDRSGQVRWFVIGVQAVRSQSLVG